MRYTIIVLLILTTLVSCISIKNRKSLMPLDKIGNNGSLKTNGYYYLENYIKTNPYYRNEYGGYSRDSTITYSQVRISTLALKENGSSMKLGSFSGMQDNLAYNFGVKCNLDDNNTLQSAFEHFECYVNEYSNKGLFFLNAKAEIWDQGVYKIEGNNITIHTFYNSIGNYNLYEEKGKILNDTTFVLDKAKDFQTGENYDIEKIYRFKKMENFPEIDNYILKNKKKFQKN